MRQPNFKIGVLYLSTTIIGKATKILLVHNVLWFLYWDPGQFVYLRNLTGQVPDITKLIFRLNAVKVEEVKNPSWNAMLLCVPRLNYNGLRIFLMIKLCPVNALSSSVITCTYKECSLVVLLCNFIILLLLWSLWWVSKAYLLFSQRAFKSLCANILHTRVSVHLTISRPILPLENRS